ncbi:MAG TPA: DUF4350 domain-containing protein [Acidimicrobiales bacterium]|nr:DUF4350 domain-containing protein [Acidimicrobiales bacterium]
MSGSRRGLLWVGLVVIVIIGFAVVGRGDDGSTTPLAPDSTSASGMRALVLLAESFGADVDVVDGAPASDRAVAFMPSDRFGRTDTSDMRRWISDGGILVVADPQSTFVPRLGGLLGSGVVQDNTLDAGDCTIAALSGAQTLSVDGAFLYRPPASSTRCFTANGDALIVAIPEGRGTIVAVGGSAIFQNGKLDEADNAVVAVSLLAPKQGTKVAFVRGPSFGAGEETLWGIIRPGIRYGFLQVAIAFLLFAIWRGRRLGRPVLEIPRIEIEGSEFVEAVGHLLERTNSPTYAAAVLRADARREIARRVGGPRADDPEALAALLDVRLGADRNRVRALVTDTHVADENELVALAQQLHSLRQEVLSGKR